ncbi:MAG TPA: hypothetical protein VGG25_25900, partial [Streptosporangiaceae bacterium]
MHVPATINSGLADASNGLLLSTVILYALAMLAYACDFAFRKDRLLAPEQTAQPALVPAGVLAGTAGAGAALANGVPAPSLNGTAGGGALGGTGRVGRWPTRGWLRTAFWLTCVGAVTHVAAITTRGLAEHRVPWGNMYEFIAAITCMAALVLIAASIRFRAYYIGLFVLIPV